MKNILIIFYVMRHSSSTLCEKIYNMKNCTSVWELFNQNQSNYPLEKYKTITGVINAAVKDFKKNDDAKLFNFKIFPEHLSEDQLMELIELNNQYNLSAIILTRKLEDSYKSLVYARITGDWDTKNNHNNPQHYKDFKRDFDFNKQYVEDNKWPLDSFEKYKETHNIFFNDIELLLKNNGISYKKITFEENIKNTFDIEKHIQNIIN